MEPVDGDARGDEEPREGEHRHWGEAVAPNPGSPARPGDILVAPGEVVPGESGVFEEPIVGKAESTPLADDESTAVVPPCPLWAMKEHRHVQWHLLPAHDRHERLRDCIGAGDEAVYAIDDGRHHVMLGRRIGARPGGAEYCLIARAPRGRYDDLARGAVQPPAVFFDASELRLCGVVVAENVLSSNVFDVARYDDASGVPESYLPGSPFIEFEEDLDATVD